MDILYFEEDKSIVLKVVKMVLSSILWGFIFTFAVILVMGIKPYVVVGWSMEPTISYKALAFDQKLKTEEYKISDIITYSFKNMPNRYITHRIIGINYINDDKAKGVESFITRGDNPSIQESAQEEVVPSRVVGKVIFHLPLVGDIVLFINSHIVSCIMCLIGLYIWFGYVMKNKIPYEG